ncbi:hypothetical protein NBRC116594_37270 [Shimia sp. NS0008-38b]|uniref:cysteine hydrolase family protein n=1 Tax=Shimia sp. NS0008-38b TaxID=3127653 RepID=UPI00310B613C
MIKTLLVILAVGFVGWLANGVRLIGAVSLGERIPVRPKEAVLLIDLQTVFWEQGPYSEADKALALATIVEEVNRAKAAGVPVIAMRQEWSIPSTKVIAKLTMGGQAIAGSKGTEIATPFADLPDFVLTKRVQDSFETGDLDALLAELDVGRLTITGLDARYCVAKSIQAAKNRGYQVDVVQNAVLSADHASGVGALEALVGEGTILR